MEKVRVVKRPREPTAIRELRRLLGLAGYCRRFIKGFRQEAARLYALVASDTWQLTKTVILRFAS